MIHALAEETVVYNALEGLQGVSSTRAAGIRASSP